MMSRQDMGRSGIEPRQIEHGWDVYGSDDEKVGDVSEVRDNYLVVSKGILFPHEHYVPFSAITGIEHDRVYLNVTKDQIEDQGWDEEPTTGAAYGERREQATRPGMRTEDRDSVQLREEELQAQKRPVQTGEARIGKEVVSEQQTMEVPVTREEAYVERRPVERRPSDRPISEAEDETIRIPLKEEQVEVQKRPVVTEEVSIGKRAVQDTEQVSGTVRREEARIEREGNIDPRKDS